MPAVPFIGERPTAKMTSATAAHTSAAATRCGLWFGLVSTNRIVREVVPCQLLRPISGVSSPPPIDAWRGATRGRGKGTVGFAGRRESSRAGSIDEGSNVERFRRVSIGLQGAPSMVSTEVPTRVRVAFRGAANEPAWLVGPVPGAGALPGKAVFARAWSGSELLGR
jgi:hypothetical protein